MHYVANNGKFTSKVDTPTKPIEGRKSQQENVKDFCRLCGVNLKIKFGYFSRAVSKSSGNLIFPN